jgi:hypothetical protein
MAAHTVVLPPWGKSLGFGPGLWHNALEDHRQTHLDERDVLHHGGVNGKLVTFMRIFTMKIETV